MLKLGSTSAAKEWNYAYNKPPSGVVQGSVK